MFFLFGSLTMAQNLQNMSQNLQKSPDSYRLMPGFTYGGMTDTREDIKERNANTRRIRCCAGSMDSDGCLTFAKSRGVNGVAFVERRASRSDPWVASSVGADTDQQICTDLRA